jgi:hypothetical protein
MKSRHSFAALLFVGVWSLAPDCAAQERFHNILLQKASALKPQPGEYRWQQVPWLLDVVEAQRRAQDGKRPLLLWISGDDPLERC